LPEAATKKPQVEACGEVDECLELRSGNHQPARVGKVIPTTKGFKWLTARIHGLTYTKMEENVKTGIGQGNASRTFWKGTRVRVRSKSGMGFEV
jgi:hypothetical protein